MGDVSLSAAACVHAVLYPFVFSTDHRAALGEMGLARIFRFYFGRLIVQLVYKPSLLMILVFHVSSIEFVFLFSVPLNPTDSSFFGF